MILKRGLIILGGLFILGGVILLTRLLEPALFAWAANLIGRVPSARTGQRLVILGGVSIGWGLALALAGWLAAPRWPAWQKRLSNLADRFEGWQRRTFGGILKMDSPDMEEEAKPQRSCLWKDVIVAAVFLALAVLFFLGRVQRDYPNVFLGGDAANIASFAAAWDHPDLFHGDALLGDLNNIRIYSTVHIPLLRGLVRIASNYSLAMAVLLIPTIFLQLLGFYTLGRVLFRSRYWGLLLALLTLAPIGLNLGEAWGLMPDALPRFTFQALLPFLLAATWAWRGQPRRWPLIMAGIGGMVYIHPVSTPAWMLAIWLSLWLFIPKTWRWLKRIGIMTGLGTLAVVVAAPFALNYLGSHQQGQSASYELVYYILVHYFPENLLSMRLALADFTQIIGRNLLILGTVLALGLTGLLRLGERKKIAYMITLLAGVALVSIAIPWIEQTIERYLRLIPIETELVRGIRYFIPLMLILILWPIAELASQLRLKAGRAAVAVIGALLVTGWWAAHPTYLNYYQAAFNCLRSGRAICPVSTPLGEVQQAAQDLVPPGEKIFSTNALKPEALYALGLRYQSLRPLVFSYKDRGLLGYSSTHGLAEWFDTLKKMEPIQWQEDPGQRLEQFTGLADELGARYLLADFPVPPDACERLYLKLVYQNEEFTLLRINN